MTRVLSFLLIMLLAVPPALAQQSPAPAAGFADLAERLLPSVVNISSTQKMNGSGPEDLFEDMPQFPPGSPFEEFFKQFQERAKPRSENQRKVNSLGSGFILSADGYIVTNNHVIQDADEITVILQDNTNLSAKLVGKDKKTDLALLKVKTDKPLPAVTWGNSDSMRVGDWVIAIGNPFGLGGTVTAGIISARARDINAGPYDDFLQTDASINRGNSGGPMFNANGEVIGVNTAIYSPSGGSVGIGFAIPSTLVKSVIDQLKEHGHTRRGWMGVRIQSMTPEIAESIGLPKPEGALVSSATEGGPAAVAGIQSGDVIVKFDGKDINEMRRLPRIVAETPVNKTVPVQLWRKGKELTVSVKVGELESHEKETEDEEQAASPAPAHKFGNLTKLDDLGIAVAPLSAETRKKFDIPATTKGIVIVDVKGDGDSAERGVTAGDVIVEVGGKPVATTADLLEHVKSARAAGRPVLLLLAQQDDLRFVAIPTKKPAKE